VCNLLFDYCRSSFDTKFNPLKQECLVHNIYLKVSSYLIENTVHHHYKENVLTLPKKIITAHSITNV